MLVVRLFYAGAGVTVLGFTCVLLADDAAGRWAWIAVELLGGILVIATLGPVLRLIGEAEPRAPGGAVGGPDAGPRHRSTREKPAWSSNGSGPHTRHRAGRRLTRRRALS